MSDTPTLPPTPPGTDPWPTVRRFVQDAQTRDPEAAMAVVRAEMEACATAGWLPMAVALADEASNPGLPAGAFGQTEDLARRANAWAQASGDRRTRGVARIIEAKLSYHLSDESRSLQAVDEAWNDLQHAGDAPQRIDCLTLLGAVVSDLRHDEVALTWHQQALDEAVALAATGHPGAHRRLARAHSNVSARLVNLGDLAFEEGRIEEARELLTRCVEHAEQAYVMNREINLPGALGVCERLRRVIEQEDWAALSPGLQVTASIGVHDVARHATLQEALAGADRALYRAKRGGRNRVDATI